MLLTQRETIAKDRRRSGSCRRPARRTAISPSSDGAPGRRDARRQQRLDGQRTGTVPGKPVTLSWANPTGQRFELVLSVDDGYMFTVRSAW